MFRCDMIEHLIILKRDVVTCHSTINQNRNNYQKSKTICIMVNKIGKLHNVNDNLLSNSILYIIQNISLNEMTCIFIVWIVTKSDSVMV
jgi:hypothetical protein